MKTKKNTQDDLAMKSNFLSKLFSSTGTIKIYEQTYKLPLLKSREFWRLQKTIQKRQQLIKQSQGLKGVKWSNQSHFNSQFNDLENLIRDYDKIIQFLHQYQESFQQFFSLLAEDITDQDLGNFQDSDNWYETLSEFLLKSGQKQERIRDAFEQIQTFSYFNLDQLFFPEYLLEETSLIKTLNRIQLEVESKLNQFSLNLNPEMALNLAKNYHQEGMKYYLKKDYGKTLIHLTQAINLNPLYVNAYYNRGLTYYQLKEYDKALEDYHQALRINPHSIYAYNGRGFVYYELKEYNKALEDYNQALTINSQFTHAYYNRGLVYYDLKEYDKAREDYHKVLAIDPHYTDAYKKLIDILGTSRL